MRHRQDKVMKSVTLEQNAYVAALRMFAHPDSAGKKAEDAANLAMHSLYCLLLGAVAILLLTSIDVADFVSALQRWGHAPHIIHVKRLHVLTEWIQANPKNLAYNVFAVQGDWHVGTCSHQRVFLGLRFLRRTHRPDNA